MTKYTPTPKQACFVDEYLIDLNGTQAAIRAGYSPATANEQASRLLANVNIRKMIEIAKAARSEKTKIDAAWVLTRLVDEAVADVADLYYEGGGLKPVHEWPLIWRQGLVSGLDVEQLFEAGSDGRKPAGVITKIKLPADRSAKRLELIGKHVDIQAYKDRVTHEGEINITIGAEDAGL